MVNYISIVFNFIYPVFLECEPSIKRDSGDILLRNIFISSLCTRMMCN